MADGVIQVAPDSTGKKVDTSEITVGANTVERQRIVIASNSVATDIVGVGSVNSDGDAGDIAMAVEAYPKGFNGTTWDRLRCHDEASDGEPSATVGRLDVDAHLRGYNGTAWDRIRCHDEASDGEANATLGRLDVDAHLRGFNGTTWDRLRSTIATGLEVDLNGINGVVLTAGEGATSTGSPRMTLAQMGTTSANLNASNGNMSLGCSTGKTNAFVTGNLASVAVTADQVIATRTVTAGKTYYIESIVVSARLTTFATTATWFGAFSLETPSGTKVITLDASGAGAMTPVVITFPEPIPVAAGAVVRLVCTPGATTAYTWKGAICGYEK